MATRSNNFSVLRETKHASLSALPIEFSYLARIVNFNLPLKLDRDNFVHWKTQVLPAIQAFELGGFVSNTRSVQPKYIELLSSNGSDKEMILNKEYAIWRRADKLLLCWLLSTMHPSILGEITRCVSSQELKQQLQCIKKGASSVSEFMLKVKSVGDALKAAGEVVRDNDLILSILNGIGHEYDPVAVLIASQKQIMTLQEVQCQPMIHEQRIAHLNSSSQIDIVSPSANFAASHSNNKQPQRCGYPSGRGGRDRGRGRNGGGRWHNKPSCQMYGKAGHSATYCYNKLISLVFEHQGRLIFHQCSLLSILILLLLAFQVL
ncbi:hypothetical protein ACOSP7_026774 [Xanthoceras sorbifolium]